MNKSILIVLLGLIMIGGNILAQTKENLIYIDRSNTSQLQKLQSSATVLVNSLRGKSLLFISNDTRPKFTTSPTMMIELIERLADIDPGDPNQFNDVDTLNYLMTEAQMIKGIDPGATSKSSDSIFFHFFLELENMKIYRQDRRLVVDLLLINDLLQNGKVKPNCSVIIHLDCSRMNEHADFLDELRKQNKYEIDVY